MAIFMKNRARSYTATINDKGGTRTAASAYLDSDNGNGMTLMLTRNGLETL